MENRGNRASEELASSKTQFRSFRASGRNSRTATEKTPETRPSIEITLDQNIETFQPGDFLICEYFVSETDESEINAIETSVIWLTEGKGEEDIGVHFFERRLQRSLAADTFQHPQRLSTVLPASPLTYEGEVLKIRWCVRVRLYLLDGQQVTGDKYFRLGKVKPFEKTPESASDSEPNLESES